jgi:transcriptional regulator with XRE-family HTH domain
MYERIKTARKFLNLNQTKFAESIGLTQTALSMIEIGRSKLTEKNVKLICSTHNISERWLRSGEGDMFCASPYEKEFHDIFTSLMPVTQEYLIIVARELLNTQKRLIDTIQDDITNTMQTDDDGNT